MLKYILKRLGVAFMVALTVSVITFSLIYVSGDPAVALAGEAASNDEIEHIRKSYGYDRPIPVQYMDWLGRALQGDLGRSHYLKEDISDVILTRLPNTLILAGCAIAFALILSIPLGVAAAIRPNSLIDRFALTLAVVGQALPSFWFALIMMFFLGIQMRWLPISRVETWQGFIMPSIAL
ncbi:MAG: ABC transporter permease, partial [Alphaproteobacteria bacterium]